MFIIKDEANVNKFNFCVAGTIIGCAATGVGIGGAAGSVPGAVIGGAVGTIVGIW